MKLILILDIIGTFAFAVSGVLTGLNKRFDPFGILILAFVAAIGGGTLRDILIKAPVAWMDNLIYVYVIVITTILTVVFRKRLTYVRRSLLLSDTLGIALYTIVGVEKGITAGFSPIICIALGTITACFGGVIRDILSNQVPIIFHREIYATACITGGVTYFILLQFSLPIEIVVLASGLVVMLIRLLAIYYDFSLPSVYTKDEMENNQKY